MTHDGEVGATATEYALVAGLIAAVITGTVAVLGQSIIAAFQSFSVAMGW
jgi:Flp pilus assembly pilin Flp